MLIHTVENPYLWCDTEFEPDLEIAGMKLEMRSMLDFDMFYEGRVDQLTQEQLDNAISTKRAKTRKPDGARLVVRGFDQKVDGLDDTFASTPCTCNVEVVVDTCCSVQLACHLR